MNIRVLLVDDEKDFIESLAERLKLRDFEVSTAVSGEEALEKLDKSDFDVAVLDVQMPGKDGIDTLKEIKNMKPLTQVIMLTGHATVKIAIEGMKQGAFDFLLKPTETKELIEKIKAAYKPVEEQREKIRQAEINNIIKTRGW